jgi:threonine aldolase
MNINLKSDTITRPTPAMLEAMLSAKVGDDVYKEDPTANKLEASLAHLFGMEAGLFFPTGSMANQAAIKLHTQPGEQLICDHYAHVFNYEGGGVSFNSGVSCQLIKGDRGMITAQQVASAINPPDFYHSPLTTLVCVENTTNKGGGACYDITELKRIQQVCKKHGLRYHLDGARIWNALEATDTSPKQYGELVDSISVCLSKGLGCPVGSVLLGSREFIDRAMRVRKVLGGGMRQIGYLAAAGLFALEHHRERLVDDHRRAKELEATLKKLSIIDHVAPVETNIVIFTLVPSIEPEIWNAFLTKNNISLSQMGEGKWRIVTHLDYTEAHHQKFLKILLDSFS